MSTVNTLEASRTSRNEGILATGIAIKAPIRFKGIGESAAETLDGRGARASNPHRG